MQTLFGFSIGFGEVATRGWFPWYLSLALGLIGVAAVVYLYVTESGRIGVFPRICMACVRTAIVVVVAVLLLRPVWINEHKGEKRRPVAVMLDVSESMKSEDPQPNKTERPKRIDVATAALLNEKLDLIAKLDANVGPVEMFTFGSRRTGRNAKDREWLKGLKADEPQTGLADQVAELLARDPNDLPSAIVLVTDGRENASRGTLDSLARECARLEVPIHIYGVGSSSFGQLQVRSIDSPEGVFVDDAVAVPVHYRVVGVSQGTATISLKLGDREVAKKVVNFQPIKKTVMVNGVRTTVDENLPPDRVETLVFVPLKEDADAVKLNLTAKVTIDSQSNNVKEALSDSILKGIKVVDRKLKVLVIDSIPRFDFKYLMRALLRDRRVEASFYLTDGDQDAMISGPPWVKELANVSEGELAMSEEEFRKLLLGDKPAGIAGFDLLILGDIPGKYFTQRQQEIIRSYVTEGGGLIHMAGKWHAPAGWVGGPIAEILPVEFEAVRFPTEALRRPDPFYPILVDAAARSPLVTLEDEALDNAEVWGKKDQQEDPNDSLRRGKKLPPLFWNYPVTKLKPAAEVYLAHPREKTVGANPRPMPLLAGHYFGKGFVLFVGFDETWRWRFNEADKYFGRFWSQAVYVAGVSRVFGTKLTQLSIDTTEPIQGRTGQVYATVFKPDFKPLQVDVLGARLTKLDEDGTQKTEDVKFLPVPGQPGQYVAAVDFNKSGRFKLVVDPHNENPADLEYRVGLPPDHELAPGPMDEAAMRKLAIETGGRFYREEDLSTLPGAVVTKTSPVVTRTETVWWNKWALFLLVGLMTLEWVIRVGKGPMLLPNGKPLTVRFTLDMGGAPPVFQRGYFSRMACVAEVAH